MEFRGLTAEEVVCKVEGLGERESGGYAKLLLYHDPTVDRAILNETVGSFGWQAYHYKQDGLLCCRVGIDKYHASKQRNPCFLWRSGVGRKRFEEDQGESSSAFQRACAMWGIGEELYTAPRILVSANVYRNKKGYHVTDDIFKVLHMQVEKLPPGKKCITELVIARYWKDQQGAWQQELAFDWKKNHADSENN